MNYKSNLKSLIHPAVTVLALCSFLDQSMAWSWKKTDSKVGSSVVLSDFAKDPLSGLEFRSALEGPGSRGGGNACALMIRQNTQTLLEKLTRFKVLRDRTEDYERLIKAINSAKFVIGKDLYHDGQKVDAINDPTTNTVEVEKAFCDKFDAISDKSTGLLLHEYLGLARINDKGFQISGDFVRRMNESTNVAARFERFQFSKGMDDKQCLDLSGEYDVTSSFHQVEFRAEKRKIVTPGFNPIMRVRPKEIVYSPAASQDLPVITIEMLRNKNGQLAILRNYRGSTIIDGKEHTFTDEVHASYYEKYQAGCQAGKLFIEYGSANNTGYQADGKVKRMSTYVLRIVVTPITKGIISVATQSEHFNADGKLIYKDYEKVELSKE